MTAGRRFGPRAGIAASIASLVLTLAGVGFSVAAQFVTIQGLETPYYIVMAGVVLLRTPRAAVAAVELPARPAAHLSPRHPAMRLPRPANT